MSYIEDRRNSTCYKHTVDMPPGTKRSYRVTRMPGTLGVSLPLLFHMEAAFFRYCGWTNRAPPPLLAVVGLLSRPAPALRRLPRTRATRGAVNPPSGDRSFPESCRLPPSTARTEDPKCAFPT